MSKRGLLSFILLIIIISSIPSTRVSAKASTVEISVMILNVEKVDLSEGTHRIDFELGISYVTSEISLDEIRKFQFANGEPSVRELEVVGASRTTALYRVRGDFVTAFKLGKYPFDSHNIEIIIYFPVAQFEHKIETDIWTTESMVIVGWDYEGVESRVYGHYNGEGALPKAIFGIKIRRPLLSTILKNIMPIAVISAIALLTFLISPSNPSQRIGLGVSTLLSATAFHLSLLGGIPPTGEFTIADGIMLSAYLLHFYSLLISVYLMRLKEREEPMRAETVNKKAIIFLPVIIIVPIAIAILINL